MHRYLNHIRTLTLLAWVGLALALTMLPNSVPFVGWVSRVLASTSLGAAIGHSGLFGGLALLLYQIRKGKGFFRTLYYLPSVVPATAVVMIWMSVLEKNFGMLNGLISLFRPGTAVGWVSNYSFQVLTILVLWSSLGAGMIIFLAGLQNIPGELLEAARIDGANGLQILWKIIIPLMTPVIFFQLIIGLISVFQQLTYPLLLVFGSGMGAVGIPTQEIRLYMFNAYYNIIGNQRYGYCSALLWLLFIGIVILSLILFWSQRFWVHTDEVTG